MNKLTHNQNGLKLKDYDINTAKKISERQRRKLPTCPELYEMLNEHFENTKLASTIIKQLRNEENPSPLTIIKHFRLEDEIKPQHKSQLAGVVKALYPMEVLKSVVDIDGKEFEVEEYIHSWSSFFEQYSMDNTVNAKSKYFKRLETELEDILIEVSQVLSGVKVYAKQFYQANKSKIHETLFKSHTKEEELIKLSDRLALEEDVYKQEQIKEKFLFKKWVQLNQKKPQMFHNTKVYNHIRNNYILIDGEYQDANKGIDGVQMDYSFMNNS